MWSNCGCSLTYRIRSRQCKRFFTLIKLRNFRRNITESLTLLQVVLIKFFFVCKGEYEIRILLAKQVVSDATAIQVQGTI